jgi:hypothetical protein
MQTSCFHVGGETELLYTTQINVNIQSVYYIQPSNLKLYTIARYHNHHHSLRLFKSSLKKFRAGNFSPRLQVRVKYLLTSWHVWILTDIVFWCHMRLMPSFVKVPAKQTGKPTVSKYHHSPHPFHFHYQILSTLCSFSLPTLEISR